MMEQAQDVSSSLYPKAGPSEGGNRALSTTEMSSRRSVQLIGHRLAQIGDELDSRWREKLPTQWPWWAYPNMLTWAVLNGRIVGRLWWSEVMPVVQASWTFPRLHTQGAITWIGWVYNSRLPYWSCKPKWFLVSAVLLVTAAAFTASWERF